MKKTLIIINLFLWSVMVYAQTITTTAGTLSSCAGQVVVPVTVTNFSGVASVSLVLNFNSSVLTYDGYQNMNAVFPSGTYIVNSVNSKIIISWAAINPVSIGSGTLIELKFNTNGSSGSLTWDTQTAGYCEYGNYDGTALPATFVNGAVNSAGQVPAINGQPSNVTVVMSNNTSFYVSATGVTSYQWQKSTDSGATWTNVTNVAPYSGATAATLSIGSVPITMNGYQYKCIITGICPPTPIVTDTVTLTVINLITVTSGSSTGCPGTVVIPVSVTNANNVSGISLVLNYNSTVLTYTGVQNISQMFITENLFVNALNGKVYISYATATPVDYGNLQFFQLLFTFTGGSGSLTWDSQTPGNCEITDDDGNAINLSYVNGNVSASGTNPVITYHPTSQSILAGGSTSFSVGASGATSYQWQRTPDNGLTWPNVTNGAPYSGATSATLYITGASLAMNGSKYRCVVNGSCPPTPVTSNVAILTVNQLITVTAGSFTSCPGAISIPVSVTAADSISGISLVLNFNSQVLTYQGYSNVCQNMTTGELIVNSSNGKVYISWASTNQVNFGSQQLMTISFSTNGGASTLTWDTQTAGACEFANLGGGIISSVYVNGNVSTAGQFPVINTHPVNTTVIAGTTAYFSVSATGATSYQWQFSTNGGGTWSNVGGNSATLTILTPTQLMSGNLYHCVVGGACPPTPVTSNSATLTVLQLITTTAGTVNSACAGNLLVPVSVTSCDGVGSISLVLNYNASSLGFDGYQDVNPALNSGNLFVNATGGKVYISWASVNPISIGSTTLLKLKFISFGISGSLTWDTQTAGNCEYANGQGNIIASSYTNGSVTVPPSPLTVNAGQDVSLYLGSSTTLNGTVSGGVSPYTFSWAPATGLCCTTLSNPVATPDTTTVYTLTVTASNGCSSSDNVKVTVLYPAPDLQASNDTVICLNEPVELFVNASGATPPYHYLWSNGSTDQVTIVYPSYTGYYYVSVTDIHNALAVESVHIQVNPLPFFSLGNDTIIGLNQSLLLTPGSGFASYLWSDGSAGETLTATESGNYSVTVTNQSGCSYNNNINVTVQYQDPVIIVNSNVNICEGSSVTLNTTVFNGVSPYTLIWSDGSTTSSITVSPVTSTYYGITVTDSYDNHDYAVILVSVHPLPVVSLGDDISLNFGQSTVLNAGGGFAAYLWSNGVTLQTLTVNQPGEYSVTVTDQYGCSGSDLINVTIEYLVPVIIVDDNIFVCQGSPVILNTIVNDGVTPYSFAWSNGATTSSITVNPLLSTIYGVTVTDFYGYTDDATINIIVNQLPLVSLGNDTSVNSESIVIDAGPGFTTYQWNNGSAGQTIEVFQSGLFTVTVTNQFGCSSSDGINITIVYQTPVLIVNNTSTCLGSSVNLNATVNNGVSPYFFIWSNGSTNSSIIVSPSESTNFGVTVTDYYDNSDNAEITVIVHPLPVVDLGNDTSIYEGESLILDAGEGFVSYLWNNGSTLQTISVDQSGSYSVTVTDQNGCSKSAAINVTVLPLTQDQYINLPAGWSIMSTYIIPTYPDVSDVFFPVIQNLIILKSGAGDIYWPQFEVNNIEDMVTGEGYQIKMTASSILTVTGLVVNPSLTPVTIPAGWSIIGYLLQNQQNLEFQLASIINQIIIVKNGGGDVYWPAFEVNTIEIMVPGEGYQVKMSSQVNLTYQVQ